MHEETDEERRLRALLRGSGLAAHQSSLLALALPSIHLLPQTPPRAVRARVEVDVEALVLPEALRFGLTAVAASSHHCLGLRADGSAVAWGLNAHGGLGDGSRVDSDVPVDVIGLAGGVTGIATVGFDSMALLSDGSIVTWGMTEGPIPVPLPGLGARATAIAGGLALLEDGSVQSWGQGSTLGDGRALNQWGICESERRHEAAPVVGLPGRVIAISAGGCHCLALLEDGSVVAWGNNDHGVLGNGTSGGSYTTPAPVHGLGRGVLDVVAAGDNSFALRDDGFLFAWGLNRWGSLGDGTTTKRTTPVEVVGIGGAVAAFASSWAHSLVLRGDGALLAWGQNHWGELGDGTTIDRPRPVLVEEQGALSGEVRGVAAGPGSSFAFLADGSALGWGRGLQVTRVELSHGADAELRLGASKLGGRPDLPASVDWPVLRGSPLSFVAQVDLDSVAVMDPSGVLPSSGLLSFFYSIDHPSESDGAPEGVVVFTEAGTSLSRREFPRALGFANRYAAVPFAGEPEMVLPAWTDPILEAVELSEPESDAFWNRLLDSSEGPSHRLLGHPSEIQTSQFQPAVCARALGGDTAEWTLLAQFDNDVAAGMDWGDAGRLFYWVRRNDLAAARFDRAWVIAQSN